MSQVWIVNSDVLKPDTEYEPPLTIGWGISGEVGSKAAMGRTIVPPKGRNQRHYHKYTDALMFIRKGKLRFYIGPDDDIKEYIIPENHFVFCPKGTIHGIENMNDKDNAEIIFCYPEVPDKKSAGTVYMEKPWV